MYRTHLHIPLEQMVWQGKLLVIDTLTGTLMFCELCTMGKMKKLLCESQEEIQASRPLQIIYTDIGGPITPKSREGYRCWLLTIDDFSQFLWIHFSKKKSEVLSNYNQWEVDVHIFFKQEIEIEEFSENYTEFLQSDGGGEYTREDFQC